MKKLPFYLQLVIFSAMISILIIILKQFFPGKYIHQAVWGILTFYVMLTLILHYITINAAKGSNSAFMTAVFGSIGFKLLLSVAFIIFYLLNDTSNSVWFAIDFIVLYLFFTVFEIYSLLRNLRTLKNK
ncbi:MAG TPA: hypothetical protein DIT07_02260 [Sphingobacteriaceae bacterium]|nr:hypothetical protein [Sphingobacteriaceae bacterium]